MKYEYFKDFDGWNIKKKLTDNRMVKPPLFKEREIWWVSVGINIGYEEDGKNSNYVRPVLIIKKFSKDLFVGIPMSTKIKDNRYYVSVTLKESIVSVLISQIRTFSSKRMWNRLGELDKKDFRIVLERTFKEVLLPLSPRGKSRG